MTITLKIGGATTGRKFTDPIRYFKANDPYYWEVDNIPLKQLQENVKYINDRMNTAIVSGNLDVSRQDIAELKPYCNNNDDVIRVKPGRYTARINNAHNIDHLDAFHRLAISDDIGKYTNYAWDDSVNLDALIARLQSTLGADALNLNGLSERVFAQLTRNPDEIVDFTDEDPDFPALLNPLPSKVQEVAGGNYFAASFPLAKHLGWYKHTGSFNPGVTGTWNFKMQHETAAAYTGTAGAGDANRLFNLTILENSLIKYWRGTARTAIVDVPTELEINIPVFDEDDFEVAGATSRIDLVFIYSKPVDTSAVTIGKYGQGGTGVTRTKITEPILGVLHGAGLVLGSYTGTSKRLQKSDGTSMILAAAGDQNNTDNGFKVGINQNVAIHGSFPSPEDLLNIAPLLSEQLEEDSWFLTGQTIFPVAYVKVNKQPGVNVQGSQVITSDDIVDIRPLFRTAELTYNERAGIAAAMPPLSLANRAVGRYELEYEINALHHDHDARLTRLEGEGITFTTEQTHFFTGASDRGGPHLWSTWTAAVGAGTESLKDSFRTKVGVIGDPTLYNLTSKFIHPVEDIISVFIQIEGKHMQNGPDNSFYREPTIWVNSITSTDNGVNRSRVTATNAVTVSKYSDRPVLSVGVGARDANIRMDAGSKHSFELPVEYLTSTSMIQIYFWAGDETPYHTYTEPDERFAEYYWCQLMGYKYRVNHAISLIQ